MDGGTGHWDKEPWKGIQFGEEGDEISFGSPVGSWVYGLGAQGED